MNDWTTLLEWQAGTQQAKRATRSEVNHDGAATFSRPLRSTRREAKPPIQLQKVNMVDGRMVLRMDSPDTESNETTNETPAVPADPSPDQSQASPLEEPSDTEELSAVAEPDVISSGRVTRSSDLMQLSATVISQLLETTSPALSRPFGLAETDGPIDGLSKGEILSDCFEASDSGTPKDDDSKSAEPSVKLQQQIRTIAVQPAAQVISPRQSLQCR